MCQSMLSINPCFYTKIFIEYGMRLVYYSDLPDLRQFGIQVPVFDTRASRTLEHLRDHPRIGAHMEALLEKVPLEKIEREDLARVHSRRYVDRLYSAGLEAALLAAFELIDEHGGYNRYDPSLAVRPLADLFGAQLTRTAGSLRAMRLALENKSSFFFGGGFHHAHADFGHGFCVINDIVIGIRRLQHEGLIKKAWIIDTDAHKGDGTAALTENDDSIGTLSIHMAAGWPLDQPEFDRRGKRRPSYTPSTIDIPIAEGEESEYCRRLASGMKNLRKFVPNPDLAVVVYGADPYAKDGLPSARKLSLSLAQMMERDRIVFEFLQKYSVPAAYLMAGGYGLDVWEVYYQFLEWVLRNSTLG